MPILPAQQKKTYTAPKSATISGKNATFNCLPAGAVPRPLPPLDGVPLPLVVVLEGGGDDVGEEVPLVGALDAEYLKVDGLRRCRRSRRRRFALKFHKGDLN